MSQQKSWCHWLGPQSAFRPDPQDPMTISFPSQKFSWPYSSPRQTQLSVGTMISCWNINEQKVHHSDCIAFVAPEELVPLAGTAVSVSTRPAGSDDDLVALAEVLVAVLLSPPDAVVRRDNDFLLEYKSTRSPPVKISLHLLHQKSWCHSLGPQSAFQPDTPDPMTISLPSQKLSWPYFSPRQTQLSVGTTISCSNINEQKVHHSDLIAFVAPEELVPLVGTAISVSPIPVSKAVGLTI